MATVHTVNQLALVPIIANLIFENENVFRFQCLSTQNNQSILHNKQYYFLSLLKTTPQTKEGVSLLAITLKNT